MAKNPNTYPMIRTFTFIIFLSILGSIYAQNESQINTSNNCEHLLRGIVKDMNTQETVTHASVKLFEANKVLDSTHTGENADFTFSVACNKRYIVKAKAENYAVRPVMVYSSPHNSDKVWEINLVRIREFRYQNPDKLIDVDNILFLEDSEEIMPESKLELQKVVKILERYPNLKISINVHSDSKGIESYNLQMTQDRADTIMSYLISKGIDSDRLTAMGYGSQQLLNDCTKDVKCTEAEHKINRRVEFVIM